MSRKKNLSSADVLTNDVALHKKQKKPNKQFQTFVVVRIAVAVTSKAISSKSEQTTASPTGPPNSSSPPSRNYLNIPMHTTRRPILFHCKAEEKLHDRFTALFLESKM